MMETKLAATQEFVNQFGFDPTALLTSKSKEVKNVLIQMKVLSLQSKSRFIDRYPDVGYYICS